MEVYKIKLIFEDVEKELHKNPESLNDLKNLFHKFFPEANKSLIYNFKIHQEQEDILITEDNFVQEINILKKEMVISMSKLIEIILLTFLKH